MSEPVPVPADPGPGPVPADPTPRRPPYVLVSHLIEAAKEHLERHGDTPVGVVVEDPLGNDGHGSFPHIGPAIRLGCDKYDEDGPWFFEVECEVNDG